MVDVINVQNTPRKPSAGALFGSGFGQGVGQVSTAYLENKMKEMFIQREADKNLPMAKILAKKLGANPGEIEGISQMLARQPAIMGKIIEDLPMRGVQEDIAGGGIPANRLYGTGGGSGTEDQGQPFESQQAPQQNFRQQTSGPPLQTPSSLTPAKAPDPIPMRIVNGQVGPQNIAQEMAAQQRTPSVQESLQSVQAPQQTAAMTPPRPQQPGQAPQPQGQETIPFEQITPQQLQEYVRTLPAKAVKPVIDAWNKAQDVRRKEEELALKRTKTFFEVEKTPREFIKQLNTDYGKALKQRPIYKLMESKAPEIQKGSVARRFLMDRFELPAGMMLNPTEEGIDKVAQQLLRGISADYKGRILQSEVENYMRSNPSLLNSPEGMQKLARMSMALDKMTEKKWHLKNEIVAQHKKEGQPLPEDLESEILEKAPDYSDEAYYEIEKIMGVNGVQKINDVVVVSPEGKSYTLPKSKVNEALQAGWKLG